VLSYSTGWISVTGWLFLVGTGGTLGSGIVLSIASLLYLDYLPSPIQTYTIYTLITLMALATNLWLTHLLPSLTRIAFIWSLVGILTLSLISLLTTPSYSSPSEIFLGFQNATGWSDGFAWLLGLLQGALALTGYDTVAHMCEEIHKPSYHGPVVMMCAVTLGCGTGLLFLLSLLFSATDIPAVITAPEGPLLRILLQATGSVRISVALQVFPLGCLLFATTGIMTTASRMVFAFSRDGGLPFSTVFSRSTQGVPVPALLLTAVVVEIVGLLYFLSEKVLEALVSAAVVSLSISYALPVMVNMLCRRRKRLEEGVFVVPGVWGWGVNIVGAGFVAFTVALFLLPTRWPVTTGNMNYACVGLMGIALVSWVDWVARGRRKYVGPKIEDKPSGEGEQEGLLDEEVVS
jgi:choline transport protein